MMYRYSVDDIMIEVDIVDNEICSLNFVENSTAPLLKGIYKKDFDNYFKGGQLKQSYQFPKGTQFQISVWKEIICIPYGQVKTYSEIAEAIGKPKAYRAVANACGANPLALYIPCHRVVSLKGLGGYSFGIPLKKKLLQLEKFF